MFVLATPFACGPVVGGLAETPDESGALHREEGDLCDNREVEGCADGLRCQHVWNDGDVDWQCVPHGDALDPGSDCEVSEDCGPGLECAGVRDVYACAGDEENADGESCESDEECPSGTACEFSRVQWLCAPRCTTDRDCDPDQRCESRHVVYDGQTVLDVFSVCEKL
jgi:hypothetical protein